MKKIWTLLLLSVAAAATAQTTNLNLFGGSFDQRFVREAARGNLQEITLGQLAETNSQDTNVQNFGALLVTDHSAALAQLQTIATNLGVTLPTTNSLSPFLLQHFSSLTGPQFDRLFIAFMIRDHILDIQRYENGALRGQDASVRDYARTNLPVLTDHLVVALTLRESMLSNQPAFTGNTGTNGTTGTTTTTTVPTIVTNGATATGSGGTGTGTHGAGTGSGSGTGNTTGTGSGTGTGNTTGAGTGAGSGTGTGTGVSVTTGASTSTGSSSSNGSGGAGM